MNLFVANWKMHKTLAEARAFAAELGGRIGDGINGAELVLAPPWTAIDAARDVRGRWALACQNVAAEAEGAFTGEVSAAMAADAGCRYAIVGHSERRQLFAEDGPTLEKKLARCREAGLTPIYCIGETAGQRDAGLTEATLVGEIATLRTDPADAPLVVAYEPIWAIGTGRSATPEDCASACARIRQLSSARRQVRILYGGSVTPENAAALLAAPGVNGFLIGGASLSAASFEAIARA
jgi:triosephosphate isomerase (TIM)